LAAFPAIGSAKAGVTRFALTKKSARAKRVRIMADIQAGGLWPAM
jgi:hypothetical protein